MLMNPFVSCAELKVPYQQFFYFPPFHELVFITLTTMTQSSHYNFM